MDPGADLGAFVPGPPILMRLTPQAAGVMAEGAAAPQAVELWLSQRVDGAYGGELVWPAGVWSASFEDGAGALWHVEGTRLTGLARARSLGPGWAARGDLLGGG